MKRLICNKCGEHGDTFIKEVVVEERRGSYIDHLGNDMKTPRGIKKLFGEKKVFTYYLCLNCLAYVDFEEVPDDLGFESGD
jgi:hypothetical protein